MEIHFDDSDFKDKLNKIVRHAFPERVEKGLGVAMLDLLNDCIMETPTVPIKEGWLRGSGSIFVQNRLLKTSVNIRGGKDKYANTDYIGSIRKGSYEGIVGFNAPYAARMHEGIDLNFTEPSSGAKFLESKLVRKREVYIKDIADAIKGKNA